MRNTRKTNDTKYSIQLLLSSTVHLHHKASHTLDSHEPFLTNSTAIQVYHGLPDLPSEGLNVTQGTDLA